MKSLIGRLQEPKAATADVVDVSLVASAGQGVVETNAGPAKPATDDLYRFITESGYYFSQETVARYVLALKTKPLVVFSGISGIGKTKLAQLVAEFYSHVPGTPAKRFERPKDTSHMFYLKITGPTLSSGTLFPEHEQYDYFDIATDDSQTISARITNVIGAMGDTSMFVRLRATAEGDVLSVVVPATVRRAVLEMGAGIGDYLRFDVIEERKRFDVSIHRAEGDQVNEIPENRCAFVSVRPNWGDHTALLGCYDNRRDRYDRTRALELILRADREYADARASGRNPAPYFLILDEMNLAKVEHYFADFLSALESRRRGPDGGISQETVVLHHAERCPEWTDEQGVRYEIPHNICIPPNLLITGTLNMDDTTFGLSPKVLDRANVIEFTQVHFDDYLGTAAEDLPVQGDDVAFALDPEQASQLKLGTLVLPGQKTTQGEAEALGMLLKVNRLLETDNRHFGYRALDEISLFIRNSRQFVGESPETVCAAVDIQIVQKVLPRLNGTRVEIEAMLEQLLFLCLTGDIDGTDGVGGLIDTLVAASNGDLVMECDGHRSRPRYPRSSQKLYKLLVQVRRTGSVSALS